MPIVEFEKYLFVSVVVTIYYCVILKKLLLVYKKAKYQQLAEPIQPLHMPKWKWEEVAMDFVVGLPKAPISHDTIWMVIDRLTKSVSS